MSQTDSPTFSGIRSYLWPIHAHEIPKLVPLIIILSCVALSYSILRPLKDTIVISAQGSGAEVIPFIKTWGMFPAAVLSTILFSYLLNHFSRATVFRTVLIFFGLFFAFFALYIYPNRDALRPHASADFLQSILPMGCRGLIAMYRNWALTCFYIIAELWGTLVLQVFAWGLANEITKISEAPRFYAVLTIASNIAAFIAGQAGAYFSSGGYDSSLGFGNTAWEQSLIKLLMLVCALTLVCLATFRYVNKYLDNDEPVETPENVPKSAPRQKLSFVDSLFCIVRSKYLINIGIMVIAYNLVISLVEIIWKDRLYQIYPNPADFNIYTNNLTSAMSIFSTTGSILMAGFVGRFGWTNAALLTPMVLLITSAAFLGCLLGGESIAPFIQATLGTTPLFLAITLGSVQNCFSKAAKYSVFDATKEMAYIPLETDEKIKGKSAIDGIGSRMAKSAGSIIHQGLLVCLGSLALSTPYIGVVVIGVIAAWIYSVRSLGKDPRLQGTAEQIQDKAEVAATPA
jgi:ATP:ADP antiporter, AAA family